ncbi:isoleucine--tRNA ligase [Mucisphaera calidilacus]|uniref:Isoleucine--tRNA ligase n=1 Tax=Mucisphaera calidilacus TaxID=2527982 RepID=A0A518BTD1_9BACT|nr:isoleucine--tRNA ligase [Mucisphaera calidilacus]QDU70219.1 Isoleucine--tRNA ligase [Mucisphaera calidilacus]
MAEETKKTYRPTLNLPKTPFAMRANLVQNEPQSVKRWAADDLYARLREARKDAPAYVFHDGPPYANGSIHLGHLLNKVLKDIIVRSRSMMGFNCPYTPGWDCHGLPIEHRVMQDLGPRAREMSPLDIRRQCKKYAEKHVKTQKQQMLRLLTLADYDDPYLTMLPRYEQGVLRVFADLVAKGLVYRQLKPVHWSVSNRTALAEAELEYYDREDHSIYVLFPRSDADARPGEHVMIWTTTPWTLPANLAVAASPRAEYGRYALDNVRSVWLATDLAQKVLAAGGMSDAVATAEPLEIRKGEDLRGMTYTHPFLDDRTTRPVVTAEYVTLEDGTGLVHTAPGHGSEDYQTGLREKLDIYCPVLEDGTFDDTAPDWLTGRKIWDANPLVLDKLNASGHLFHNHTFTHSYPHDWRGKQPVIFRATEQWFIAVDNAFDNGPSLRDRALAETADKVNFLPGWGRNRMRGMLESRPDWCVSRQRSWGLPIPAIFPPEGVDGPPLLTPASVAAVADCFAQHGSDAWYKASPADLLDTWDPAADPDAPAWAANPDHVANARKGGDTFDVWFESGSSWNAVMRHGWKDKQTDTSYPTDLYLEGSDQHRGWFQHSLLPALAVTGQPPFRTVLTHGFMVDKDGKKMSKSLGNTIEVEDLMKKLGADVARWWVASLNTDNDIKVDWAYFETAGDEYRKLRNTLRFLLGSLPDAATTTASPEIPDGSIDAWALAEHNKVLAQARDHYDRHAYRPLTRLLFNYCNETLSAVYLAAVKDRLYCDADDSPRRQRTEHVMGTIARDLVRLLAPILPHTADEAHHALEGKEADSVHLETLAEPTDTPAHPGWDHVMTQRELWLKAIETARQQRSLDNPLDLGLTVPDPDNSLAPFDPVDLADLCGVSRFATHAGNEIDVADLSGQPRCERSWKRDGTVRERSDGGLLSDRDAAALGLD